MPHDGGPSRCFAEGTLVDAILHATSRDNLELKHTKTMRILYKL